jgi:hypothetical protein
MVILALHFWLAMNSEYRMSIFSYSIEEAVGGGYFFHQNLYSCELEKI